MNWNSIILWLFLAWILLAITDMWFDIVSGAMFIKITVTMGLLVIAVFGVWLAKRSRED